MPATAPIPPLPAGASGRFGVATGHDGGYGRFLVANGPYMVEGSERLDFSLAPARHAVVAGYVPVKSVALVRNPSWDAKTDALRPAYVDRIEVAIGGTNEDLNRKVDSGALDLNIYGGPPPQVDPALVHRLLASNTLAGLFFGPSITEKGNNVTSLIGAAPDQLRKWGYRISSVPSIDAKIRSCNPLVGDAQTRCWAEADQQLMEEAVPVVPFAFEDYVQIVSPRVVAYSFDQFAAVAALDRIALRAGS